MRGYSIRKTWTNLNALNRAFIAGSDRVPVTNFWVLVRFLEVERILFKIFNVKHTYLDTLIK